MHSDKMSHFQQQNIQVNMTPQQKRMMHSGGNSSKRCVSETKKKYVASSQNGNVPPVLNNLNILFK